MRLAIATAALLAAAALPSWAQPPRPVPEAYARADKGHCGACHQLPAGLGAPTRSDLGPALAGARMRGLGAAALRALLDDPTRANPDTVMPPFGRHRILDKAEIDRLVEFLLALP